ncbi:MULTISPECIES: CvpA family protein [Lactobacillus]|uniref:CvpA family protein n=1 Tax=Lactobacillus xujianguonis TaxID=2495899 RepID=A0A437SU23_9LACO|nr:MULTISPECIES: CvpA family protein [Lactobacillus]RVU70451.1 CvpA family protein [Lactobacillus xujianguonis]RVU73146.1 CvpA family protein [Lactobacillus xujianguonis]
MIVTLIVLIYLLWQAYNGFKTGFTRYIINLIFAAIVFMVAIFMQNPFGNWLYTEFTGHNIQTNLTTATDLMLYRFLAFFLILFVGRMVVKIFKSWIPTKNPHATNLGSILDSVLGALASLIAGYFFVYVILSMLNALQNPWFMQQTVDSSFLRFIIYNTPGLSNSVFNSIFSIGKAVG